MKDFANKQSKLRDDIQACPYCDGTNIHERTEPNVNPDDRGPWVCYNCRETFAEPRERPPKL